MAKQIKLTAQTRTQLGRNAVKKIKSQGLVPAVIYGTTGTPANLQIGARDINKLLSHAVGEHLLVDLEIVDGGKTSNRLALIQEVQHHAVTRNVLHVDFLSVDAGKKLHSEVTIEPVGEPIGVKSHGGILELNLHSLEVECLPQDLPEFISVDVSALQVGDAIHIKDIVLPAGVTARGNGELTVIHIAAPKVEVEPAAGSAAAPEVLKEKKPEGDKK
ncbi:MAG: ctc [Chthoniobacteraceae bacterium]|nr:ctc [Chthoniobacteraceae bacterium]